MPGRSRSGRSWPTSGPSLAAHPARVRDGHRRLRPRDPGAHEAAGDARRLRAGGARRRTRCATVRAGRRSASAAVLLHPGRVVRQRVVGPVRVDLRAERARGAVAALNGRNGLAAALLAVSLMTKPQADPVRHPVRGLVLGDAAASASSPGRRASASVVIVVPVAAVHPAGRADRLPRTTSGTTRTESSRSCRCGRGTRGGSSRRWRPAATSSVTTSPIIGPFTFRHIGYVVTALCRRSIGLAIVRDPRPGTLILGLAASVLTFFTFMTQMHERYAYAAVVILLVLCSYDRRHPCCGWCSASC